MNDDLLALQAMYNENINMQIEVIESKPIVKCKCGFPNPYIGEEEKFCPDDAVDVFEANVEGKKFSSYICQHHINIMSIMYDNKKLGQMIRQGDIRGEWLL